LREGDNLIGRTPDCAVRIDSSQVSRHHARIRVDAGHATIEDLASKNGTFVEGARLRSARPLRDGEHVCIGPALLIFREGYGPGSTKTAGRGDSSAR
jgi:pSer/pThr/pTyr-binding forkhead associated (FHA) protein